MKGDSIQYKKQELIKAITKQSVYQPCSGMLKNVEKALTKMSQSDLWGLKTLIEMKVADAERAALKAADVA